MDPITLIALARTAAEFVPGVARWLGGDRAGEVAGQVVEAAKYVTGLDEPQQAMEAIRENAALQAQLQQALAPVLIAEYEAETRRLEAVNATMRAEATSGDKYVSRWRPTLGYVVTATWGIQMGALSWLIFTDPDKAVQVIAAMVSLSSVWMVALGVLGVGVSARSRDKQVAAGQEPPPSLLGALAQRLGGQT